MDNKKLDVAESLELITSMIQSTQANWERNAGRPSLIFGYVTVFVSVAIWTIVSIFGYDNYHINYLWFAIPVLGGVLMHLTRSKKPKGYKTYVDKMIQYTWIVLGGAMLFCSIIAMFYYSIPILFTILLLISSATILTGLVIKFKIYTVMGLLGMSLSILCLIYSGVDSCLIFAAEFVLICIIPGHILNYKSRRHV